MISFSILEEAGIKKKWKDYISVMLSICLSTLTYQENITRFLNLHRISWVLVSHNEAPCDQRSPYPSPGIWQYSNTGEGWIGWRAMNRRSRRRRLPDSFHEIYMHLPRGLGITIRTQFYFNDKEENMQQPAGVLIALELHRPTEIQVKNVALWQISVFVLLSSSRENYVENTNLEKIRGRWLAVRDGQEGNGL